MKTLRVSDDVHQKLTALLSELMAQTSKMQKYEYVEIPREKYEKLNRAVKDMVMPYYNAAEFIEDQIVDKPSNNMEGSLRRQRNRKTAISTVMAFVG